MINNPSEATNNDRINTVVSIPPFDMELDFTNEDPLDTTIFGKITKEVMEYLDQYGDDYKQNPRLIVMLIKEISKNVKHHGWGTGYIHIESEYDPIIQKNIFHFVIGDFGEWMKKEWFDYENFLRDGHPVNKPWTHGIGGGLILAYTTALEMDLVVYDNENRRVMYGRHKGYNRKPKDRRWGKGVHYVGTTILEEEPDNPALYRQLDFSEDQTENKEVWNDLRNSTVEWIEKHIGRTFETHGLQMHELMTHIFNECWKNVQDHGWRKGYYYLEKEYDPLLGQDILHFIIGDKGKWITTTAWSLDNFFKEWFSTGNEEKHNTGRGGYFIKEAAKRLNAHLVLYEAEKKYIVNNVLHEYDRITGADKADPSEGAHFVGSLILPKITK